VSGSSHWRERLTGSRKLQGGFLLWPWASMKDRARRQKGWKFQKEGAYLKGAEPVQTFMAGPGHKDGLGVFSRCRERGVKVEKEPVEKSLEVGKGLVCCPRKGRKQALPRGRSIVGELQKKGVGKPGCRGPAIFVELRQSNKRVETLRRQSSGRERSSLEAPWGLTHKIRSGEIRWKRTQVSRWKQRKKVKNVGPGGPGNRTTACLESKWPAAA